MSACTAVRKLGGFRPEGAGAVHVRLRVQLHPADEPVAQEPRAVEAAHIGHEYAGVGVKLTPGGVALDEAVSPVFTGVVQALVKDVTRGGRVDVQHSAAVLGQHIQRLVHALFGCIVAVILAKDRIDLAADDLIEQSGHILEMIIEGVAVDIAVTDDVEHGHVTVRALVEKLHGGCHDQFFFTGNKSFPHNIFVYNLSQGRVNCFSIQAQHLLMFA